MLSADCLSNATSAGRNLTPSPILLSSKHVMGGRISWDLASDAVANQIVGADHFISREKDSYAIDWSTILNPGSTVFLNPPGSTITGGTVAERTSFFQLFDIYVEIVRLSKLQELDYDQKQALFALVNYYKQRTLFNEVKQPPLPVGAKWISGSKWWQKLIYHYGQGHFEQGIYLCYRAGSIGSLGMIIQNFQICLTAKGAESDAINGSGRFAFGRVTTDGEVIPQTSNPQSSAIVHVAPQRPQYWHLFKEEFKQYGAVK